MMHLYGYVTREITMITRLCLGLGDTTNAEQTGQMPTGSHDTYKATS